MTMENKVWVQSHCWLGEQQLCSTGWRYFSCTNSRCTGHQTVQSYHHLRWKWPKKMGLSLLKKRLQNLTQFSAAHSGDTKPETSGSHLLPRCLLVLVAQIFVAECKGKTIWCREELLLIEACLKYQTAVCVLNKWFLVWAIILTLIIFSVLSATGSSFLSKTNCFHHSFLPVSEDHETGLGGISGIHLFLQRETG